jgi:membrane-associated protease RseP (regulator of RpoE activity)
MHLFTTAVFDLASFFAVATALVLAHELGHYLAARANGVPISVFSIGFGPELVARTDRKGTRWKLCALPLGGYIRMSEADPGPVSGALRETADPLERQGLLRKAIIALAGPLANFVFAALLIAALIAAIGSSPEASLSVGGAAALFGQALALTWQLCRDTAAAVLHFIIGGYPPHQLVGPIRLVEMTGAVAHRGLLVLMGMTAILSVNLGITNLLPIPTLDGGHLLLYVAEAVRGRPVGRQTQSYAMRLGLALVIGLMVFATWNDLVRLGLLDLGERAVSAALHF